MIAQMLGEILATVRRIEALLLERLVELTDLLRQLVVFVVPKRTA